MKRVIATGLWFVSVWCVLDLVAYSIGIPRVTGPVVAALAAGTVALDPFGWFWPRTSTPSPLTRTTRQTAVLSSLDSVD